MVVAISLILSLTITLWYLLLHLTLTATLDLIVRIFFLGMGCCHGFFPYCFPYYYPYCCPLVLAISLGPHNHPRPTFLHLPCHGLVLWFLPFIFPLLLPFGTFSFT